MTDSDPLAEARDPRTPPDRLEGLLRHGPPVVAAVAANPSVSPAMMEGLLGVLLPDSRPAVVDAFLGNPSLPLWLLADPGWLARFGHPIAMDMARSPRLTTLAWESLIRHTFSEVRWLLLASPAAPPGAWQRYNGLSEPDTLAIALATGLGDEFLAAVAARFLAHPDVPRELASGLVWLGRLPASGALALARSPALTPALWETVSQIGVHEPEMLPAVDLALARSPSAPPDVWSRLALPVSDDGALRLRAVADDDLRELARSPRLDRLVRLDLSGTRVGDAGMRALASASLPRLSSLNLYRTQVGDDGLSALLESPSLPALTELLLPDCRVTDEGARRLLASPRLAALTRLDLRLNHAIGEATWQQLREAAARHPGLTLEEPS